jgi:hypothetical protein
MGKIFHKKAQHETMGFVLIIIIVTVIGLGFLYFLLRTPAKPVNSAKVSALISSAVYYTTDCYETYVPNYLSGLNLIKKCSENCENTCGDGRKYKEVINETFNRIITNSIKVGEDYPIKAYRLGMYFDPRRDEQPNKPFFNMSSGKFGNCTTRYGGTNRQQTTGGDFVVELSLCERDAERKGLE